MENIKQLADAFASANAPKHVGKNCRKYSWGRLLFGLTVGSWGFTFDKDAFEGVLVEANDDFSLIKVSTNKFEVVDNNVCPGIKGIDFGSKVKITPYHRKRFNGSLLGTPVSNGNGSSTWAVGEDKSYLPFDKKLAKTLQLKEMLTQLEVLKKEGDYRTTVQMLIDAGANESNFSVNNPEEDDIISSPPAVTFGIEVGEFKGSIEIAYDRASDDYTIRKFDVSGTVVRSQEMVYFDEVPQVVESFIDDDSIKFAKIEVIKAVKLKKAA